MPLRKRIFLLFLMLLPFSSYGAVFEATVDTQRLAETAHLTLTLRLINSDTRLRAEGIDPNIDLTLLANDFDVGVPRSTFRYSIKRTHGRATSEVQVELFPRRIGHLTIPIFSVDGLTSKTIDIQVVSDIDTLSSEVFVETGFLKKEIWRGESTLLYLDLFHRVALKSAVLGGNLDSRPLNLHLEKLPEEARSEKRQGVAYQVTRTAWVITPVQQENYLFYLPDIWVETAAGKKVRFPVKEEMLVVNALPVSMPDALLIGKPRISLEYPKTIIAKELFTWTIVVTIDADSSQLPERLQLPTAIKGQTLFHGAVSKTTRIIDGRIEAVARYPVSMIPSHMGKLKLPEIKIAYFNPDTGMLKYSLVKTKEVWVSPHEGRLKDLSSNTGGSEKGGAVKKHVPLKEEKEDKTATVYWQGISVLLLCLWLTTLFFLGQSSGCLSKVFRKRLFNNGNNISYKERLLDLLESNTIEEGMRQWRVAYGRHPLLEKVALKIQRHCYGSASIDTDALEKALTLCEKEVSQLRKISATSKAPPWEEKILANTSATTIH